MDPENRCWEVSNDEGLDWSTAPVRDNVDILTDVWSLLRPGDPGFTFSNLPWAGAQTSQNTQTLEPAADTISPVSLVPEHTHTYPARPTRPDRIFVSGLAQGEDKAAHGLVPRRIVRHEDGSQYRRLHYWSLMAHRTRHLIRTLVDPVHNPNPHYTYKTVYTEFYRPLVELWDAALVASPAEPPAEPPEEPPEDDGMAGVSVDEAGRVLSSKRRKGSRKAGKGGKEESVYAELRELLSEHELYGRLWAGLPFRLPLYVIAVAPTVLLYALALAACLCCSCRPLRPTAHIVEGRRRCRFLCCCTVLALLPSVAVALCAAVFFLPILFTDYIDDLVPSDHRLVVASLAF